MDHTGRGRYTKMNLIVVCFALNCTLLRHMYRQRNEHRRMPRTRPLGTPYAMQTRWRCCAFLHGKSNTINNNPRFQKLLCSYGNRNYLAEYRWMKAKICRTEWEQREKWQIIIHSRSQNLLSRLSNFWPTFANYVPLLNVFWQIVEQCGLWRKPSTIAGNANPRVSGGVKVSLFPNLKTYPLLHS